MRETGASSFGWNSTVTSFLPVAAFITFVRGISNAKFESILKLRALAVMEKEQHD